MIRLEGAKGIEEVFVIVLPFRELLCIVAIFGNRENDRKEPSMYILPYTYTSPLYTKFNCRVPFNGWIQYNLYLITSYDIS